MKKNDKIFIAGHNGLVGNAILSELRNKGYRNLITFDKKKFDLSSQRQVDSIFKKKKIDIIFLCAAKVGGIISNSTYPWDFISINSIIQHNVLYYALKYKVKKICLLGSSCIYPKKNKIPIQESDLLSGYLEKTNESYALSKILGLKMAEALIKQKKMDIRVFMPCNIFGIKDKFFDDNNNHVIPAMIKRFDFAKDKKTKNVKIWGSGKPLREFCFANDLAINIINCMTLSKKYFYKNIGNEYFYNIGSDTEISIKDLADKIKDIVGYKGQILFDKSKPDGTFRKYISKKKINNIIKIYNSNFRDSLEKTYLHYLKEKKNWKKFLTTNYR